MQTAPAVAVAITSSGGGGGGSIVLRLLHVQIFGVVKVLAHHELGLVAIEELEALVALDLPLPVVVAGRISAAAGGCIILVVRHVDADPRVGIVVQVRSVEIALVVGTHDGG